MKLKCKLDYNDIFELFFLFEIFCKDAKITFTVIIIIIILLLSSSDERDNSYHVVKFVKISKTLRRGYEG